jgi:predicted ATPase
LNVVDRALQLVETYGERYYEAEIRRLRGEFAFSVAERAGARSFAEAERWLLMSIQLAQKQCLGSLELRSALSLAQLSEAKRPSGKSMRALQEALGKVHGGESTADVRRARAIVREHQVGEPVRSD